ncbi:hypothetical protein Tco_0490902 [Tanacetum coccineum]
MDVRRWQKKMHFFLTNMSVVYVLSIPILDNGDDATMKQMRKRSKWENDDYMCRGLILNGMSKTLFDIYQFHGSFKELWDSLKSKYMAKVAYSKKFMDDDVVWTESRVLGFYAIEPNEFVSINSIIESRDAIFDENRFSSIPRLSHRFLVLNGTDDIGDSDVSDKVPKEVLYEGHGGSEKLKPNNGKAVSQLEYSRVIGCLMYAMTYTMLDIALQRVNRVGILVILVLNSTGK